MKSLQDIIYKAIIKKKVLQTNQATDTELLRNKQEYLEYEKEKRQENWSKKW